MTRRVIGDTPGKRISIALSLPGRHTHLVLFDHPRPLHRHGTHSIQTTLYQSFSLCLLGNDVRRWAWSHSDRLFCAVAPSPRPRRSADDHAGVQDSTYQVRSSSSFAVELRLTSCSLKHTAWSSKTRDAPTSQQARERTPGPSNAAPSAQSAAPHSSASLSDVDDIPGSPLSSPPSSPPSTPVRARAGSPDDLPGSRKGSVPYVKPGRLTRFGSRSSVKGSNKRGRRGSMAAIDARLNADGGVVTRYGEQVSVVQCLLVSQR